MQAMLNTIHSAKIEYIDKICYAAAQSNIVKRLFIFGSAVTDSCTDDSDLDICVDTDCEDNDVKLFNLYSTISKICDYNCDILTYRKLGSQIKGEVDSKGVIVYESEKS